VPQHVRGEFGRTFRDGLKSVRVSEHGSHRHDEQAAHGMPHAPPVARIGHGGQGLDQAPGAV
jgi:hypothetical protein